MEAPNKATGLKYDQTKCKWLSVVSDQSIEGLIYKMRVAEYRKNAA